MRVAFDEQIFLLQPRGGVSRYFAELIARMPATDPPVEVHTPFRRVANRHLLDAFPTGPYRELTGPLQPYPDLAAAAVRPRRQADHATRVSLVHHTFYHPRFLRDYPQVPKVVTIYDMIPEVMGAKGRYGNPHMAKREYVQRANLLLFISRSAYDDLVAAYGVPEAPVVITHLGVAEQFSEGGPVPTGLPKDYVLFVGNRSGYKDFATVLAAFAEARDELRGMHLVCVGGGGLSAEELGAAADAGLAERIVQRTLRDEEMPGAYSNAAAFVFPSRYEGFGLPALESMAAGSPAILANTSSLPEVGGDAALYFEPGDPHGLAAALTSVLVDSAQRQRLVSAGRVRASEFTWARTAQQTADAYRLLTP